MSANKETKKATSKQVDVITMARKKRHIALLEKLQKGKALKSGEIRELAEYEGKSIPPGIVKTQEELAKAFHVSVRTVQYWVRDGMPRTPEGFYDLLEVQAWRTMKTRGMDSGTEGNQKSWEDEYRKYKALLAELELQRAYGQVLDKEEVEKGRVARIIAIKRAFLALPKAVAPILEGLEVRDIEMLLTSRIREIIAQFAGQDLKHEKSGKKIARKSA